MAMIVDREQCIAKIIRQRKPFLREIESKQESLRRRAQALATVKDAYEQILKSGSPEMGQALKDIDIAALYEKINDIITDLEQPKGRFERDTLNIGVIGRARQGKSRLLQSLSDLSPNIIPTGRIGHCTGTQCMICHDGRVAPHGEVTFYTEQEFLDDVLAPYYKKLSLKPEPDSTNTFGSSTLPPLPPNLPQFRGSVTPQKMYEHLVKYHVNFQKYNSLINSSMLLNVPIEQMRPYIAQDKVDGTLDTDFKYLAVREAKIVCRFDHEDVGQIALVDMPGLGDTGAGAEERLVEALGKQIDTVLFVRMPTPVDGTVNEYDLGLYDLTYQALKGLPIDLWSFMVLNCTHVPKSGLGMEYGANGAGAEAILGENLVNCESFARQLKTGSSNGTGPVRDITVVDTIIADCANSNEAKTLVLDTVLDYLARKMPDLDQTYLASWQKRLAQLDDDITATLTNAQRALSVETSELIDSQSFDKLFDELWKRLTSTLEELLDQLRNESQQPNSAFETYFKQTLTQCQQDSHLPDVKEIQGLRHDYNSYLSAFGQYLDDMRTHLTHHFLDMDNQLKTTMDEVRLRVAQVLIDQGELREIAQGVPIEQFLAFLASQESLSPHMRETFQVFDRYELSLRGYYQSRLRGQHLNNLHPDKTTFKPSSLTAAAVSESLKGAYKKTTDDLQGVFSKLTNEPGLARYAMVEEFVDQMLRSRGARTSWNQFYRINKERVWASTFRQTAEWRRLQQEWQSCLRNMLTIHTSDSLLFMRSS